MPARILKTETDRAAWGAFLAAQPLPLTVSATKGARRSIPQNSTAAKWYAQIAAETGEEPAEVKAQCKWRHGKPIMEAERPDWVAEWQPLYAPLPYRMQIKVFEIIPLTSLLTVRQMTQYMDAVQREYRAQGFDLIDPEARKYEGAFR
jgi:hypothetical protein